MKWNFSIQLAAQDKRVECLIKFFGICVVRFELSSLSTSSCLNWYQAMNQSTVPIAFFEWNGAFQVKYVAIN